MNIEHSKAQRSASGCVLVIDDHDQVRQMLRLALEAAGFEVFEAGTPWEANQRLATSRPDALVLDLQHAETDGLDVLTSIRASQDLDTIPIVFLAGEQSDEMRWRAMRAGADWFAVRPLSLIDLQKHVAKLIRGGRPQLKAIAGHKRRPRTRGLQRTG